MLFYLILLIIATVLVVIFVLPKLKPNHERMLSFVALPVILGLGYYTYIIIKNPIEELKEIQRVETLVKDKLLKIKQAELAFKAEKGKYAGEWDDLISFCLNGQITVIRAIGSEDDTSANRVFIRDTIYVPVRDSIFESGFDIASLRYVPEKQTEFLIYAGEMKKNLAIVYTFEVADPDPINPDRRKNVNEKALKIGSKHEVKTTGNWE